MDKRVLGESVNNKIDATIYNTSRDVPLKKYDEYEVAKARDWVPKEDDK
jgi:hypothetical protein